MSNPEIVPGIDIPSLARAGFTAIRWHLAQKETEIAMDIAEALHNLPSHRGDKFPFYLTQKALKSILAKYPDSSVIRQFKNCVSSDFLENEKEGLKDV